MFKNYNELKFMQKSDESCLETYKITAKYPKEKDTVYLSL
jgi:hypothetical protein